MTTISAILILKFDIDEIVQADFFISLDHESHEFVDISDLLNLLLTECSMGINRYSFPLHIKVYFENIFFNIFP